MIVINNKKNCNPIFNKHNYNESDCYSSCCHYCYEHLYHHYHCCPMSRAWFPALGIVNTVNTTNSSKNHGNIVFDSLKMTCLRDLTLRASVLARRLSSPNLSSGSVLRNYPCVSSRRCLSSPDLSCLRVPMCLREDGSLRPTCLWDVSSRTCVSSRQPVSLQNLSSGHVFTHPCVFATTRIFARPVFRKCLRVPLCLSSPDLSSRGVFAHPRGFTPGNVLSRAAFSRSVFGRPCVFGSKSVFAGNVSSDAMCLRGLARMCRPTLTCVRRPFLGALVPDPMSLQNVSSVFSECAPATILMPSECLQ